MPYIEWSNKYTVGFVEIDNQHQRLFEMINNLHKCAELKDMTAPRKILANLLDYALYHFRTEEKYFDRFQYSNAQGHKNEHQEFESKVTKFQRAYQAKGTFNTVVVSDFIRNWILNHVLISDRKYIRCFSEHDLH
ncbi:hemerythrin family protein [bacterium]|nr:hemerythrin family protein [bacterium]